MHKDDDNNRFDPFVDDNEPETTPESAAHDYDISDPPFWALRENEAETDDPLRSADADDETDADDPAHAPRVFANAISSNFLLLFAAVLCFVCIVATVFCYLMPSNAKAANIANENYPQHTSFGETVRATVCDTTCFSESDVCYPRDKTVRLAAVSESESTASLFVREVNAGNVVPANRTQCVCDDSDVRCMPASRTAILTTRVSAERRISE